MSEQFIRSLFAERIGGSRYGLGTEIYKFEKIKRAKEAARRAHPDVELLDFGIGEPDWMADEGVVRRLCEEAARPENRFYADNGIPEFKQAAARYMARVYGVTDLDPETEINHAIGAKSALAMIPTMFINPGDITIMTSPGYPVLGTHTRYLGGEVVHLKLRPENDFLPDFSELTPEQLRRAKLLYLNYPNNPTGATANRAFLEEVVEFAHKHHIFVVYDAAYAALTFDGEKPLSFLSIPGAKEVGIEVHSLSKAFNMTGWRLGWVAGHRLVIQAFADVKDNYDSGQFRAIQWAGIYALEHPEITERTAAKYSRRHDLLTAALRRVGFPARKPRASFFNYVPIPKRAAGRSFASAEEFAQFLITEKLISTVPWDDAGAFIRLSVTFPAADEAEERRVIGELERRLAELNMEF